MGVKVTVITPTLMNFYESSDSFDRWTVRTKGIENNLGMDRYLDLMTASKGRESSLFPSLLFFVMLNLP